MVNGTLTNPVNGKSVDLRDIYFKYASRFPRSPAGGSPWRGAAGARLCTRVTVRGSASAEGSTAQRLRSNPNDGELSRV